MMMRLIIPVLAAVPLTAALGPKLVYQPIIDAKPFGNMADQRTDADAATQAQEQKQKEEIARKFRMCGITDMPDGTRKIAFLDETSGTMQSYLLGVGESQNGFTLTEADYAREYATLSKDGLRFTLGLGRGLIDHPPEEIPAADASSNATDTSAYTVRGALPGKPVAASRARSFRSRLLKRRAEAAEAEAAEVQALKQRADALLKEKTQRERREQIERIKQGLAPTVPIKLTPEEDAELEAAGAFNHRPDAPEGGQDAREGPPPAAPEVPDTPPPDREVRGRKAADAFVV